MFWMHRDEIYAKGLSVGFKVFSPGHLLWLAALAAACFLTGKLYCRLGEKGRDNMRKGCALLVVLLEALKLIIMGLFKVNNIEFLPLHLCSVGGLATLVYAMWPKRDWLGQYFAYAFFPATVLAVVFPSTSMYPWWNFYCLHTFIFHGLIMAYYVWLAMSGEVIPRYKGLWIAYAGCAVMAFIIYHLNGAFGVNYMFSGMRSDVGVLALLWDLTVPRFGRAGYTVILNVIMIVFMHIFALVYFLIDRVAKRKS